MTETPTVSPSERLAVRVKELRRQRGLSVKALAEQCDQLGAPRLNQSVITNIEVVGRRQDIGVNELLVLAHVLDASPLALLLPGPDADLAVTPDLVVDASHMVLWFAGERPAVGLPTVGFQREAAPIRWYRAAYDAETNAKEADRNARWARKDGEEAEAEQFLRDRDRHLQELAGVIDSMIEAGLRPPVTNAGWARLMIRRGWFRNPDRVEIFEIPDEDGDHEQG